MKRLLEIETVSTMPMPGALPGLYDCAGTLYCVPAPGASANYCGLTYSLPIVSHPDSAPASDPLVVIGITPDHMIKLAAVLLDPANAPQLYAKVEK